MACRRTLPAALFPALAACLLYTTVVNAQLDVQATSQVVSVNAASKVSYETAFAISGGTPTSLVVETLLVTGTSVVCPTGCTAIPLSCPNAVKCTVSGSSPFTIQGSLPPSLFTFTSQAAFRALGLDGKDQYELTYGNNLALQRAVKLSGVNGDVDADGQVGPSDELYLINHLFAGGPRPGGPSNVNGDCAITTSDILYLINYLSAGGPAPVWPSCACVSQGGSGMASGPLQPSADELLLGDVVADTESGTIRVPVFIKDHTETLIGSEKPAGHRITRIAFRVDFASSGCLDSASPFFDYSKSSLAATEPLLVHMPSEPKHSQVVFFAASDAKRGIPFTTASSRDGEKIGDLVFLLAGCKPGRIPLAVTREGTAAALLASDQSLEETTLNGGLVVTDGSITVR